MTVSWVTAEKEKGKEGNIKFLFLVTLLPWEAQGQLFSNGTIPTLPSSAPSPALAMGASWIHVPVGDMAGIDKTGRKKEPSMEISPGPVHLLIRPLVPGSW